MKSTIIRTKRLELVPVTLESCNDELYSPQDLAKKLNCHISSWPPEMVTGETIREFIGMLSDPSDIRLFSYYWIKKPDSDDSKRILIGSGGYLFNGHDVFELGYSVLPPYQNKGYATEAVSGLLEWACSEAHAIKIIAHTFPYLVPSIRVLEKNGFVYCGPGDEEGTIRYEIGKSI